MVGFLKVKASKRWKELRDWILICYWDTKVLIRVTRTDRQIWDCIRVRISPTHPDKLLLRTSSPLKSSDGSNPSSLSSLNHTPLTVFLTSVKRGDFLNRREIFPHQTVSSLTNKISFTSTSSSSVVSSKKVGWHHGNFWSWLANQKSSDVEQLYQFFKFSIQDIRLLPLALFPKIDPSRIIRQIFKFTPLITWPKNCSFYTLVVLINSLPFHILLKTFWLV